MSSSSSPQESGSKSSLSVALGNLVTMGVVCTLAAEVVGASVVAVDVAIANGCVSLSPSVALVVAGGAVCGADFSTAVE